MKIANAPLGGGLYSLLGLDIAKALGFEKVKLDE